MTTFVLLAMGGVFYGLLRIGFAAGAVFVVAIVVFAYVYTPKSFHLDADALRITRPAGVVVVPLASVSEVEPLDRFLGLSLKAPPGGNSGLFGIYGTFWKRDLGKFRMYGRSATGAVLLRTSEGRIVVTPDRRDAFLAAIRESHPRAFAVEFRTLMFLRILFALAWLACSVLSAAAPRVILVSWDGAGYELTSRLLAEGRLPHLQRMLREGAWSDGMVSSFPTKSAAAHAVLFTGHYGHRSGITANALLLLPASEHDRLETENGYFSNALRVDPVWILAAQSGLETYAMHATQAYPFDGARARLRPSELEHLFLVHGYTEAQSRGESFDETSLHLEVPAGWAVPEAWGGEARAFRFAAAETPFWGLFFDDPLDPVEGWDTLGIVRETGATAFLARVKPGLGFSTPILATVKGKSVWFSLRMLDLSPDGRHFLLYRSGAAEMAVSNSEMPFADLPVMQAYAGNGATRPYARGRLGPRLADGGDGVAEERFLETLVHLQNQIIAQAKVALEEDYDFVVLYSPVTDDVNHELVGYLDEALRGHDEAVAAALWPFVVQGFELQDTFLGVLMDAAARDDAHVIVVSDHGMAGTDRLLHLNVALAQAGLLALHADGSIDLSATRALAPSLSDGSIAVNSTGRPGGIVPLEEREEVLREVRRVLGALQDPETGEPIITAFYEPATSGLLQPGGASTGDLFLDYLPGYYPSTETGGDGVVETTEPRGKHIFVPTRRNMLAICAAWGPRIPSGTNFGKIRSIDVVPTVLDLLELKRSAELPGRSLVPPATLLNATRSASFSTKHLGAASRIVK